MNIYEKLKQIIEVESLNFDIYQGMNWLKVEGILQYRKCEKYSAWLVTGKIIPEAGQISPAIAHSGRMTTTLLF
ncbi:hypothetical protein [Xenorhabdus sp. KK7.4]|uniref:hypothetical protein n=1 Tax=Xenorhabdus sp. KK7.4 TaxID=1851572 RepID=UPI000C05F598|nr:hypothetical protein [Xenorhabdus sp. KK7.4]PHM51722.1 transcriptional regulator [Xenorhabdus sp. KK7.4]